jgi:hypothetical protein
MFHHPSGICRQTFERSKFHNEKKKKSYLFTTRLEGPRERRTGSTPWNTLFPRWIMKHSAQALAMRQAGQYLGDHPYRWPKAHQAHVDLEPCLFVLDRFWIHSFSFIYIFYVASFGFSFLCCGCCHQMCTMQGRIAQSIAAQSDKRRFFLCNVLQIECIC